MSLREFLEGYGSSLRDLPKIAGQFSGSLIVCGDSSCIWRDLEEFGCRSGNGVAKAGYEFMTVNRAVECFPGKIEHAYSNVAWVLRRFIRSRRDDYRDEYGDPNHTHSRTEGTEHEWPWHGGGTSGLGAILTGLALGYDYVVLAGMPLDDGPHNGEPPWRQTRFTTEVADADIHWKNAMSYAFEGRVKSLSGRTREWLGRP